MNNVGSPALNFLVSKRYQRGKTTDEGRAAWEQASHRVETRSPHESGNSPKICESEALRNRQLRFCVVTDDGNSLPGHILIFHHLLSV